MGSTVGFFNVLECGGSLQRACLTGQACVCNSYCALPFTRMNARRRVIPHDLGLGKDMTTRICLCNKAHGTILDSI